MSAPQAILNAPQQFQVEIDGSGNHASWRSWYRKFSNFCTAAKIEDEALKLATFKNLAGDGIDLICQALAAKETKVEEVNKILEAHFQTSKNTNKLILTFRQTKQRAGEGVEAYVIRLRTLAADCDFDRNFDNEVKLQLAAGALDVRVLQKAMASQVDLKTLYGYARELEIAKVDSREIAAAAATSAHQQTKEEAAYQLQQNQHAHSAKSDAQCGNCGHKTHAKGENCPAAGKTCSACGKKNHFSDVCRSKNNGKSNRYPSSGKPRHKVNQLISTASQQSVDEAAKPGPQEADRNALYNLFAVKSNAHFNSQGCPRVWADINGSRVNLGVDTQASINALSKDAFDLLSIRPKLHPCPIAAYSFDGKTPIQSVGSFKSTIKANGRSVVCEFVVFKGVRDNLLGFKSCIQLGSSN
jgi:hypothetical protein